MSAKHEAQQLLQLVQQSRVKKAGADLDNVKTPADLKTRELIRAVRAAIIAEESAINQYEAIVDSTDNSKAKEVLQFIANEEKTHAGELQTLLKILSPDEQGFLDDGAKEVKKE